MMGSERCKVHEGERGGRYYMGRKKGGGTERVYLGKGERPPTKKQTYERRLARKRKGKRRRKK